MWDDVLDLLSQCVCAWKNVLTNVTRLVEGCLTVLSMIIWDVSANFWCYAAAVQLINIYINEWIDFF